MAWSGSFTFGDRFAVYHGAADGTDRHIHAACQIVLSSDRSALIEDETGHCHTGREGWVIPPMTVHALRATGPVILVYLDAHAPLAARILRATPAGTVVPLDTGLVPLDSRAGAAPIVAALSAEMARATPHLDARLTVALEALARNPGQLSITEAAAMAGLSPSRLRSLARSGLGLPLSTWMIWRKLERAGRALAQGAPLAQAALDGGFADQAHFARAMRRMFGITPRAARHSLQ